MNVASDGGWLYYYTDFPTVNVSFDGRLRRRSNDKIGGASVVEVDGDRAILLGGYGNEAGTGATSNPFALAMCLSAARAGQLFDSISFSAA